MNYVRESYLQIPIYVHTWRTESPLFISQCFRIVMKAFEFWEKVMYFRFKMITHLIHLVHMQNTLVRFTRSLSAKTCACLFRIRSCIRGEVYLPRSTEPSQNTNSFLISSFCFPWKEKAVSHRHESHMLIPPTPLPSENQVKKL